MMFMRSLAVVLLASLVGYACSAELLHADSPDVIPNQYIVVLKDTLSSLERAAHILALKEDIRVVSDASLNEEVTGEFGIGTFQGFFATLGADKLAQQLAHNDVHYVETNKIVRLNYKVESIGKHNQVVGGTQNGATWGLARVSEHALTKSTAYHYNTTKDSAVDAYIVDTGILTTHVDFGGRATAAFNAITTESPQDLNGHGTHVAGTVGGATYGIHKTVALFGVKVLGATGSGSNSGVIAGINFVATNQRKNRRSVANMSLGGTKSTATDNAVNAAVKAGVAFAVAAGNDNANACNYSPAAATDAVSVGATTSTDARASFSNYGSCVNIFAPGNSITSDWIGSNTAVNTISGTSMASPHVCGVLALHREVTTDAPAALSVWIKSVATSGVVTGGGSGSPNTLLYSPYSA